MKVRLWSVLLLLLVAGCASSTPAPTGTPPLPSPTPPLAEPAIRVTRPPDPAEAARAYLTAWQADDYAAMYRLLSSDSQRTISEETFTNRYLNLVVEAAVPPGELDFEILSTALSSQTASVDYRLTLRSVHFGDLSREVRMALQMEDGRWRVVWNESLLLPELAGGNVLRRLTLPPERGPIYDRDGELLVGVADAYAIGIVPAQIDPDLEESMLNLLEDGTGLPAEYIFTFYQDSPEADFYIPITDVPAEQLNPVFNALSSYDAIRISPFTARYYFGTGIEIGYVSAVQPEEVDFYTRLGYLWAERVPRAGLELWADPYLGGKRGATLFVDSPDGEVVTTLGETPIGPSDTVYTTLDKQLQLAAQKAIFGFRGAIVVLERDTGRVLAMVSSPGFDPNLFEPENVNALWTSPLNDPENPLFNRASRGQYPLGSVFKLVTMAAALESGLFTPEDTYDCQYEFTELQPDGPILYDWTATREDEPPSGVLTLPEGLMRSCNPWFFHIGLRLFREGLGNAISDMARGFGLGSPTGIIGLPEEGAGNIPEPIEELDATNIAIGQGDVQVTPLQVATFVAAIGNGGTLFRPQMVERIVDPTGKEIFSFEPEVIGTLPVSPETLTVMQEAMHMVIDDRRGTASQYNWSFPVELAGKTGTAEVGGDLDPHAWFVLYTDGGSEEKPDIAVVVIAENSGEGSQIAAPIARRVLEVYYRGRPGYKYPWEVRIGVPEDLLPEQPEEEQPEEEDDDDEGDGENNGL